MNTYKARFIGRKVNAIGITYYISDEVQAENAKDAELALYEKYEHISKLNIALLVKPVKN